MRATVDLPEDLHRQVRSIARDSQRSLSEVVTDLMRLGLSSSGGHPADAGEVRRDPATGLPTLELGRPITPEDVRALEDEG